MITHDIKLPPHDVTANLVGALPIRLYSEAKVRAAIEADRKHTVDLIARYQERVRALEVENYALISESDNRQANNLEPLTPAEAVFAFISWLTGRSDPVTLSSRHGAAIAVDLAVAFNESQGLHRFREDFHKHIKPYPAEKDQQARSEPTDSAGYTLGPVSDGGFDPRDRGEPVAWGIFYQGVMQQGWAYNEEAARAIAKEDYPEVKVVVKPLFLAPQPAEPTIKESLTVANPVREVSVDAIADIVRDHLTAAYVCTRVWSAWSYGTMGPDDFIEASETEMADEIAAAIVARYRSKS